MVAQLSVKRDTRSKCVNKYPLCGKEPKRLTCHTIQKTALISTNEQWGKSANKVRKAQNVSKEDDPINHFKNSIMKHTWTICTCYMHIIQLT